MLRESNNRSSHSYVSKSLASTAFYFVGSYPLSYWMYYQQAAESHKQNLLEDKSDSIWTEHSAWKGFWRSRITDRSGTASQCMTFDSCAITEANMKLTLKQQFLPNWVSTLHKSSDVDLPPRCR